MQRHLLQTVTCLLHTRWCAVWACKYVHASLYMMMRAYKITFIVQINNDVFFCLHCSLCVCQTSYMGFLDYRKQAVRELGINPNDCSFNPGVFVADIDEWKKQKITIQLEKWMSENFKWEPKRVQKPVCYHCTLWIMFNWVFQDEEKHGTADNKKYVVVGVGVSSSSAFVCCNDL